MVSVKIDLDAVMRRAERLAEAIRHPRGLMSALADWLLKVTRAAFQEQRSPKGIPWTGLSEPYKTRKARLKPGKPMLDYTGAMKRLTTMGFTDRGAWVETRTPYASVHQFGGRAGRRLAALIPARPFQPGAELAETEGARIAEEYLQDATEAA